MTDLIERLRKRSEIRRQIPNRKSVQNNEPDRIADLLDEAANAIEDLFESFDYIYRLTGPNVPSCVKSCLGCEYEWNEMLRIVRNYIPLENRHLVDDFKNQKYLDPDLVK